MRVFTILIVIGVLPWLTGCASTPAPTSASPEAAKPAQTRADVDRSMRVLHKGMTAEEVQTAWGAPVKIEPMEAPTGRAEVWTYRFSFVGGLRQVQTSEIVYTRPNPLTGIEETLKEPVFSTEQTMIDQIVDLLFYDGRLTEWKQEREVARSFH
jgi:hypothetical protein